MNQLFICARVGHVKLPIDFGWMIQHVRRTEHGADVRSRFWLGGKYASWRGGIAKLPLANRLLQQFAKADETLAKDLLLHTSEEMNHLASFLPNLFHEQYIDDSSSP